MSFFGGKLTVDVLDAQDVAAKGSDVQLYTLTEELTYSSDALKATIVVPRGFITDFGSIPRIVWSYMDPEDPSICWPSVVHDYFYKWNGWLPNFPGRIFTRLEADQLLKEAMELCGARWDQRAAVFAAVRAGGWLRISHWHTKEETT